MSYLTAYLSTIDAMRIYNRVTTRAKNEPNNGRTFEAMLADLFVDQMLTAGDGSRSGGAVIGVTIYTATIRDAA